MLFAESGSFCMQCFRLVAPFLFSKKKKVAFLTVLNEICLCPYPSDTVYIYIWVCGSSFILFL